MSGFIAQEVLAAVSNTHDSFLHMVNNAKEYRAKGGSTDISKVPPIDNTKYRHDDPDLLPTLGVNQTEILSPLVKTVQILMNDIENMKTTVSKMKKFKNIS